MPSDFSMKTANVLHRMVQRISGGKIGWTAASMPVVQLTTIGRKSNQPRTVMLTSPLQEDGTIVVVASRGGADKNPAWLHNLKANPQVRVVFSGQPEQQMTARVADEEERARLWPKVSEVGRYATYQTKTEREIPLVLLEPSKTDE